VAALAGGAEAQGTLLARALETHLGDTHLERWLRVIHRLLADP